MTSVNRLRWLAVPTAGAGVALALSGCGGGASPLALVKTAYADSLNNSARMTMTMAMNATSSGSSMKINITANGVISFVNKQADLTMAIPGAGSMEMREVGSTLYLRLPPQLVSKVPGHKSWARVDMTGAGQNGPLSNLAPGSGTDPSQFLQLIKGVSDNVTQVGTATVRGVQTTQYHLSIDLNKAAAGQSPAAAASIHQMETTLHITTLPMDVWVDSSNLVRQIQLSIPTGPVTGGAGNVKVTMDLYDYGTPVSVTAPPAADTFDASQSGPSAASGSTGA